MSDKERSLLEICLVDAIDDFVFLPAHEYIRQEMKRENQELIDDAIKQLKEKDNE